MKKNLILLTIIFTFQLYAINLFSQSWSEIAKNLPPPYELDQINQYYGHSVGIDGNYAVVGAYNYENRKGAAFVLFYNGTKWIEQARLRASDATIEDYFGFSVGISGDNIVVGSYRDDDDGVNSGSAYVFVKPANGWTDMYQTAKLRAFGGMSNENMGYSVDISGDNIVVGAYNYRKSGTNSGAAYIYSKPVGGWTDMTQTATLTSTDRTDNDRFGWSVSISGEHIAVGAYQDDDIASNSGSAYVFSKPGDDWVDMTQTAKLTATDATQDDYFGFSVCISGDHIVVGAYLDDDNENNSGSAYVFSKPLGVWSDTTETAKLNASDAAIDDSFGSSVAISGNHIVVGAYQDDDNGSSSGSAYVFSKSGNDWTNMTQTAKLTATGETASDLLGYSVNISGNHIFAGAYKDEEDSTGNGSVCDFIKPAIEWVDMTQTERILPPVYMANTSNYYGYSLSVDGNYSVIGASGYEENKGAAFVLAFENGNWITVAKLTASNGLAADYFGWSVSISGDNVVVGAFGTKLSGQSNSGSAYIFVKPLDGWADMTETATIEAADKAWYDTFGSAVSISGDNIVVGASRDQDNGNNSGSAYVFTKPASGWINMTHTAKLLSSNGTVNDDFGHAVNIYGDDIVVGAHFRGISNDSLRTAYVFSKPLNGWADMTQTAKLTTSDGITDSDFGVSVSIFEDNIVVGGPSNTASTAYVYQKPVSGWADMTQTARLTASDAIYYDLFARSVSISADHIIVGASRDDDNFANSGSVYVFNKPVSGWVDMTQTSKFAPSFIHSSFGFGNTVDISGDNIVVNANFDSDNGIDAGAVYLFKDCEATSSTISAEACDSYTSPSGKIWTFSDTYNDTIPNVCGLDSVITINLTISNVNVSISLSNATLTASAIDNATYVWLDCNDNYTPIAGEEGHIFTAESNGSYAVKVIKDECSVQSSCFTISTIGIVENSFEKGIKLFPNPSNGLTYIELGDDFSEIHINVKNLEGKLVKQFNSIKNRKVSLNIEGEKGVYFIEVISKNERAILKLIKF